MKKVLLILILSSIWFNVSFALEKLPGSTWAFTPIPTDDSNKPFQIQFYDYGKCKHIRKDNRCFYYLGYKNKLHIIINDYSIRVGTITNGNQISGNGSNQEGERWKFKGIKIGSNYEGFTVE
tara:strand:+ start:117 stop:482 length:366 start_codon:yes stop_codon:yes gene_type:complete